MPSHRARFCAPFIHASFLLAVAPACAAEAPISEQRSAVEAPARIVTDRDGIPHLFASSEPDLVFLQGYVHARDRFFQMDSTRRQAEGTLAELLGESALRSDVELRNFGIRRAAERSLPLLSPETRTALGAYAAGVNAWLAKNPLPQEYQALEVATARPWSELDTLSVVKLLTFQLSFDLNDLRRTQTLEAYVAAGAANGFDGAKLFSEDVVPVAPFDPAAPVPDAELPRRGATRAGDVRPLDPSTRRLMHGYLERLRAAPHAEGATSSGEHQRGSNAFAVSGRLSRTGVPLLAADPHFTLSVPAPFYENHLVSEAARIDVVGVTLPGVPYVLLGHTARVAWSGTNHSGDFTDLYQERVVVDATSPSGLSTVYRGSLEHVLALPQTFRVNTPGDGQPDNLRDVPSRSDVPAAVLIVPRRNLGPLIQVDAESGRGISAQFTGFSGTRDIECFRAFARAGSLPDFVRAIQDLDVGSQNFVYTDVEGNIAYLLAGEVPLREDLEAGAVAGSPPYFLRNGEGGNEWLPARTADAHRALPFEILPFNEMPKTINPPRGFIVSANNGPTGALHDNDPFNDVRPTGGIRYLSGPGYSAGTRARRIDQLLTAKIRDVGRLTTDDLKEIQADTTLRDAVVLTPHIVRAFDHAQQPSAHEALARLGAEVRIREAVARLRAWDGSTPTGIREGYDASDEPGRLGEPSADEVADSVAATVYSVWRNQIVKSVLTGTLQRFGIPFFSTVSGEFLTALRVLLERFDERRGIGASGVDFFAVPGIDDAATRRDLILLQSLGTALDLLSGEAYATAFGRSTVQNDYRWGKLHRLALDHPLGAPFSIAVAGSALPPPLGASLPGIPIDGGLSTVDVANHTLFVDAPEAFVVRFAPARRLVARPRLLGRGFVAETSSPGGARGVLGSAFYMNLLERWLTNETYPLRQSRAEIAEAAVEQELFVPSAAP